MTVIASLFYGRDAIADRRFRLAQWKQIKMLQCNKSTLKTTTNILVCVCVVRKAKGRGTKRCEDKGMIGKKMCNLCTRKSEWMLTAVYPHCQPSRMNAQ